jgi:hypothetical protein
LLELLELCLSCLSFCMVIRVRVVGLWKHIWRPRIGLGFEVLRQKC